MLVQKVRAAINQQYLIREIGMLKEITDNARYQKAFDKVEKDRKNTHRLMLEIIQNTPEIMEASTEEELGDLMTYYNTKAVQFFEQIDLEEVCKECSSVQLNISRALMIQHHLYDFMDFGYQFEDANDYGPIFEEVVMLLLSISRALKYMEIKPSILEPFISGTLEYAKCLGATIMYARCVS